MKNKAFDCVAMKNEIQQRLRKRNGARPWSERNAVVLEAVRTDPHLSRLAEDASATHTGESKS